MKFIPHFRCEHCWGEKDVLKLTNFNEYVCLNCIKKIYDYGYLDNAHVENETVCGDLVPTGVLKVEEAIKWLKC